MKKIEVEISLSKIVPGSFLKTERGLQEVLQVERVGLGRVIVTFTNRERVEYVTTETDTRTK